jgi:glycosyltransferase involved in cell wall biosynthesis
LRAARTTNDADLIYTRNLHAVAFGLRFGHRVAYEHFRPWADQYPALEPSLAWMFRHPNFLGAVLHSVHIRESYVRTGLTEERILVAHNGYEPARMEPRFSAVEARRALELPLEKPLAVYAGRVHERKGLLAVLDLARRLPNAMFVLVGSEGEGRVEREARALANVIVRPWQRFDATVRYLYAADVLLIPPTLEPLTMHGNTVLPMKLFQYLASGRAIFAPAAPDTAELLVHDHTAVLVPPSDPEAQVSELRALLGDPSRRARIAAGALVAAASLTWDARAEKLERFLTERLAAPVGRGREQAAWSSRQWLVRTARWVGEKVVRAR